MGSARFASLSCRRSKAYGLFASIRFNSWPAISGAGSGFPLSFLQMDEVALQSDDGVHHRPQSCAFDIVGSLDRPTGHH